MQRLQSPLGGSDALKGSTMHLLCLPTCSSSAFINQVAEDDEGNLSQQRLIAQRVNDAFL